MDDNTKSLDTLQPASYNPRTMSEQDFKSLVNSMTKFGDLSGVVKNLETGNLVGGHMRLEAFKKMANPVIRIERKLEQPSANRTTAYGYIELDNGERFAYREVIWSEAMERAANIAANRIQGEFQLDQLAEVNAWLKENSPDLLGDTGQTLEELNSLLDSVGVAEKPKANDSRMMFTPDPSQAEVIADALYKSRIANSLAPSMEADTEALYLICRDYIDNLSQEQ